jgi:ABC-2 type transport system ATP-binding protein
VIEVQNLSKYFGSRCAVDNISFNVDGSTIVGFLGPNGAGKTTTIRILTGYMPPSSGTAKVAGFDVMKDSMAVRTIVGYLPESVPLYPEMRVREYLNFRGKLRGMGGAARQAAIARVVERCWLAEAIERPIGQLSKGFKQRVGLADALLHSPKVLILDEPTVGLDPTQVRETRSLLRELAKDHPILFSSHTLSEVEAICQRILIIHEGRIIASGAVDELKAQQKTPTLEEFFVKAIIDARAAAPKGGRSRATRS